MLEALLALVGVMLAPDAAPTTPTAPTTSTTVAAPAGPVWYDPHETLVGPAVVVLESLVRDEDTLVLTYRVEAITPAREGIVFEEETGAPVGPEVFTLVFADGSELTSAAARIDSTAVTFDVTADSTPDDVTEIRIDRYWLRIPHDSDFELPASRGASFQVDELITISVEAVVEQASSTIVNLGTTRGSSAFISARNPIVWVTGRGPGWSSTIRQSGAGIGGSTGIQLNFSGETLPDPMPLTVSAPQWIPYDDPITLDVGGLNRGR